MKIEVDEYHLPYFDHYTNLGIGKNNYNTYLRDKTHLTYVEGVNLLANKVGSEVELLIK